MNAYDHTCIRYNIFSQATSALDAESEHLVKLAIDELMIGRTVINYYT